MVNGTFRRSILAEREVRPRLLIGRNIGPKNPTKMPLTEDDDVVRHSRRIELQIHGGWRVTTH
jgi:hypothetical protein